MPAPTTTTSALRGSSANGSGTKATGWGGGAGAAVMLAGSIGGRVYPRGMSRPEAISFTAGNLTLAGELLLPEETHAGTAGRRPWVLLLPSWLPRDRDGAFDDHAHP